MKKLYATGALLLALTGVAKAQQLTLSNKTDSTNLGDSYITSANLTLDDLSARTAVRNMGDTQDTALKLGIGNTSLTAVTSDGEGDDPFKASLEYRTDDLWTGATHGVNQDTNLFHAFAHMKTLENLRLSGSITHDEAETNLMAYATLHLEPFSFAGGLLDNQSGEAFAGILYHKDGGPAILAVGKYNPEDQQHFTMLAFSTKSKKWKPYTFRNYTIPLVTGVDGRYEVINTGKDFMIPDAPEFWEQGGLSGGIKHIRAPNGNQIIDGELDYLFEFNEKIGLFVGAGYNLVKNKEGTELTDKFRLRSGIYIPIGPFKLQTTGTIEEEGNYKATVEAKVSF